MNPLKHALVISLANLCLTSDTCPAPEILLYHSFDDGACLSENPAEQRFMDDLTLKDFLGVGP